MSRNFDLNPTCVFGLICKHINWVCAQMSASQIDFRHQP